MANVGWSPFTKKKATVLHKSVWIHCSEPEFSIKFPFFIFLLFSLGFRLQEQKSLPELLAWLPLKLLVFFTQYDNSLQSFSFGTPSYFCINYSDSNFEPFSMPFAENKRELSACALMKLTALITPLKTFLSPSGNVFISKSLRWNIQCVQIIAEYFSQPKFGNKIGNQAILENRQCKHQRHSPML